MKKSIGFSGFILLMSAVSLSTQVHAEKSEKNAGSTTPIFSDFPASLSNQAKRPDYSAQTVEGSFIESLRLPCALNQKLATAKFIIEISRLGQSANSGNANSLEFWEDGRSVFRAPLWTGLDNVGTQKVLSFDLSELPPSGAGVAASAGNGLNLNGLSLLTDGDFSFSVPPDTSVLSARLDYECGCVLPVAGTAGAGAAVGGAFGLGIGPTVAIGAAAAIALGAALSSGNGGNGGAAGTTGTTGTSR